MATNTTPPVTTPPNVNPDITLPSGQKISGSDPNYAEYANPPATNLPLPPAAEAQTNPGALNQDGLTMEQANDPKYWKDGKYVGPSNVDNNNPALNPNSSTTTSPTQNNTNTNTNPTTTASNGFEGYDAALKAESDAKISKITGLLQQGYDNPANIATATGMTIDEVNQYLSENETASSQLNINKQNSSLDQAYKDYKAQMDSITNGTFALTPSEQASIKAIQDSYDRIRQLQIVANQNYEGAVQTGEIRSGRQEFMNQISSGIYKQAVDDGVTKIKDIENQAIEAVNNYKQAVQDKNYKAAQAAYDNTNKYLSDKTNLIKEQHTLATDELKRQQDLVKSANDQITQNLQNEKLKQDMSKTIIEGLTPALGGANQENIDAIAKYYGIDANLLTGSVAGASSKFEQDMISKGFRTINPADVTKMRAEGNDVIEYQGRAYMKEPNLTSSTNKGNIDFFRGTKKVGSSKLTGGGSATGTQSTTTPTGGFDVKTSTAQLKTFLTSVAGGDLKVSPDDWTRAKAAWMQDGGSPTDFDKTFAGYKDPNNTYN